MNEPRHRTSRDSDISVYAVFAVYTIHEGHLVQSTRRHLRNITASSASTLSHAGQSGRALRLTSMGQEHCIDRLDTPSGKKPLRILHKGLTTIDEDILPPTRHPIATSHFTPDNDTGISPLILPSLLYIIIYTAPTACTLYTPRPWSCWVIVARRGSLADGWSSGRWNVRCECFGVRV